MASVRVFTEKNIPPLHEGVSFTFKGFINLDSKVFSVNFAQLNGDVALHVNPRFLENCIVRNSNVNGVWGYEERASSLPFNLRRGHHFTLQVLITEKCFMISVNGFHLDKYVHRLSYRNITQIYVQGDVCDVCMERENVDFYESGYHGEMRGAR